MARQPAAAAFLDARILVWLLVVAVATGVPLMLWFHADAATHDDALPEVGGWLRALHSAATAWLVVGAVAHVVLRLRVESRPARGLRTGGWLLVSVGAAAATGALIAQTAAAARLLEQTGLQGHGVTAVTWLAVVHIAYATLLVLLTLYFHIAKWGWGRVFGDVRQAIAAVLLTGALSLASGASRPGDDTLWASPTAVAAPPAAVIWAWPFLLGLVLGLAAGRLARPGRPARR